MPGTQHSDGHNYYNRAVKLRFVHYKTVQNYEKLYLPDVMALIVQLWATSFAASHPKVQIPDIPEL